MKKYVKVASLAVVAAVAGYNVYQSQSVMNSMSEFALANVEALASDDEYNDSYIYKQPQTVVCDLREGNCSFNKQQKMSNTNHTIIGINSDKIRNVKVFLEHDDYYNQLDKYLRLNRFVKLAPEPLLAPLKKVHIINDCIYVLDRMNRFVCYDLEGKVLYQIYAVGNGPGEYSGINTFAMDMKRNELVLYDNLKTSLFVYTLDRGIYKRTEQLLKPNPTEMVFHQETFFYNNRHH